MAKMVVENVNVSNLAQAIKGMRNPLESWKDSDSMVTYCDLTGVTADGKGKPCFDVNLGGFNQTPNTPVIGFTLGEKDRALAIRLVKAGTDHSKFMRQIGFIADITAPMTWWWDFDTYKVATVKNSTSRMHKLGARLLTRDDFGWDVMDEKGESRRSDVIDDLNERIMRWRALRKENPDKSVVKSLWRSIIDDLPQSYMFKATWSGNYQVLRNVWFGRDGHKQVEFDLFRGVIEQLPCGELITCV